MTSTTMSPVGRPISRRRRSANPDQIVNPADYVAIVGQAFVKH